MIAYAQNGCIQETNQESWKFEKYENSLQGIGAPFASRRQNHDPWNIINVTKNKSGMCQAYPLYS